MCLIWASDLVKLTSNCVLLKVVATQVESMGFDISSQCEFYNCYEVSNTNHNNNDKCLCQYTF